MSSSINETELEKFRKISSQWWDRDGEFKILHQINPIRLLYITNKIKQHFNCLDISNLNILDVGCGGGLIAQPLAKLGANVTGIDALQPNIDIATQQASSHNLNLNYQKSTVEELALTKPELFDVILCLEVIEHIDNPADFIRNLTQLLKADGMIIISTINRTVKAYLLAIGVAEYVLNWVPKKTHNYSKFLKPSEISSIFSNNQMQLVDLRGLIFNLLTQSWMLTEDIEVNYFAYFRKFT